MKLKQESKLIMEYEKRPVNIKGWEMYQVDTDGNVYGKNGKKLKYSLNHNGYCIVNFYHNHIRKGFGVHTIVALTFIENNNPLKTQVNHKNGNKEKNNVENLEWVTPKENIDHAINVLGLNKFGANNPNAKEIQGFDKKTYELKCKFLSLADAARFFAKEGQNYRNIQKSICQALNGSRKSYKGLIWKYKNN